MECASGGQFDCDGQRRCCRAMLKAVTRPAGSPSSTVLFPDVAVKASDSGKQFDSGFSVLAILMILVVQTSRSSYTSQVML